jgi:CheY-like chemotaxis protein
MRAWENDGFDLSNEASNGKEALEALVSQPEIDVVLLDISMPVMDGIDHGRPFASLLTRMRDCVISAMPSASATSPGHRKATCGTANCTAYPFRPTSG